jgi:hypothetical protein
MGTRHYLMEITPIMIADAILGVIDDAKFRIVRGSVFEQADDFRDSELPEPLPNGREPIRVVMAAFATHVSSSGTSETSARQREMSVLG